MSKKTVAILKDLNFWSALSAVIAIFKPLKDALDILGCDGNPISFVTAAFAYLKTVLQSIFDTEVRFHFVLGLFLE
jgi:hypothetical protein